MSNIIYDVDLAWDIRAFLLSNIGDVRFKDNDIRNKILTANNDDLLRIGKIIDSPIKIVSVDKVDADFFRKNLFLEGNNGD